MGVHRYIITLLTIISTTGMEDPQTEMDSPQQGTT